MAYIRVGGNGSVPRLGSSPGCSCPVCRQDSGKASGLGEPLPWRRRFSPSEGAPLLRMPAFETINGYRPGAAGLSAAQIARVHRVAEFVAASWDGTSPVTSLRIAGYVRSDEGQPDLGQARAVAVRDALLAALGRLRPGLAPRLRWSVENRGLSAAGKAEIYVWTGLTPPPAPPPMRVPSPAEAARVLVRPETPDERIQRIIRTAPAPLTRRSFSELFWQRLDERLNGTMNRLDVPRSLRKPIRDGIRAALSRGSKRVLEEILQASGLPAGAQKAIAGTVEALVELPRR